MWHCFRHNWFLVLALYINEVSWLSSVASVLGAHAAQASCRFLGELYSPIVGIIFGAEGDLPETKIRHSTDVF